jgi:hypothetical protein
MCRTFFTLYGSLACKGFAKGVFIACPYVTFTRALREGESMRLSIVFDGNGTVLAASASEEAQRPTPGRGASAGCFDISDDVPEVELPPSRRAPASRPGSQQARAGARGEEADNAKP